MTKVLISSGDTKLKRQEDYDIFKEKFFLRLDSLLEEYDVKEIISMASINNSTTADCAAKEYAAERSIPYTAFDDKKYDKYISLSKIVEMVEYADIVIIPLPNRGVQCLTLYTYTESLGKNLYVLEDKWWGDKNE